MFDDLKPLISSYYNKKKELDRVELFLHESIKSKVVSAKTEDLIQFIIELIGNAPDPITADVEEMVNRSDAKEIKDEKI